MTDKKHDEQSTEISDDALDGAALHGLGVFGALVVVGASSTGGGGQAEPEAALDREEGKARDAETFDRAVGAHG